MSYVRLLCVVPLVLAVAFAGCSRRQSNRALDPTNELPFGVVDGPAADSNVSMVANAGGWAVDDRGVREVRVFIDGRFVNATPLNTPRPDVAKAYPQYAHETNVLGWTITIEFPSPGAHTLLVQAVDTDGATRDIGSFKVNVTG
jgi:hypothetical protein